MMTLAKQKVLILGSTGMLSSMMIDFLHSLNQFEIACTYNNNPISNYNNYGIKEFHFTAYENVEQQLSEIYKTFKPDYIINCIGILIKGANLDPENAIFINAYFPHMLMNLADELNSKLVHMSTDCVFSGANEMPYIEKDFKDGKDTYAKSKGLGEIINKNHLTLRTSVVGPELKRDGEELFHWFMSQTGEVNGFTKAIWSGVTTLVLAKVVEWAIENKTTGLYHVTNNDSIDKYTLLNLLKKHAKKNIIINPIKGKELNKSFIDTRNELNFIIPNYEEMIKEMIDYILNNKVLYKQYIF